MLTGVLLSGCKGFEVVLILGADWAGVRVGRVEREQPVF